MVRKPAPTDSAGVAIAKAEALVEELESSGGTRRGILARAGGKVPAVRDWKIPVAIILVLFGGQALVAAAVDDGTVAAIFAVGAVTVAILTGIVAALSYAQQSAIPFADFLSIVKELLAALKAIKAKDGDSPADGSEVTGDGPSEEVPTKALAADSSETSASASEPERRES